MGRLSEIVGGPFVSARKRIAGLMRERRIYKAPFYKKYPYRHNVSIVTSNRRGAIDLERRFFFNRLPKSANTSVVTILANISGIRTLRGQEAKRAFMRPSELNFRQVAEVDDFFKFTVVRNPYARVLSAYLDKIAYPQKVKIKGHLDDRDMVARFSEFCKYLADGGLYKNVHWVPQTSLMLLPIDN